MLPEDMAIFRCPDCGGDLSWAPAQCARCGRPFAVRHGIVTFVGETAIAAQSREQVELHRSLAAEYRERYRHDFARVFSAYWNRQFTRHLPASLERVLDCGCGTGDLTRELVGLARRVVALDLSEAMLAEGQRSTPAEAPVIWVASPGEQLPFCDQVFDAVCFRGALHHMANEEAALREAHRVLRSGGTLVMSEPNDDSLVLRLPRRLANRAMRRFGRDHKAFRSREWLAKVTRAGFRIRATRYFSYLSEPLCGMSDLMPFMRFFPGARRLADAMVRFDEYCARVPGLRRQSFEFIVAAEKPVTSQVASA
jgi:ubiquinone/menaquinone biosynthesis C-methylase UbiE